MKHDLFRSKVLTLKSGQLKPELKKKLDKAFVVSLRWIDCSEASGAPEVTHIPRLPSVGVIMNWKTKKHQTQTLLKYSFF